MDAVRRAVEAFPVQILHGRMTFRRMWIESS